MQNPIFTNQPKDQVFESPELRKLVCALFGTPESADAETLIRAGREFINALSPTDDDKRVAGMLGLSPYDLIDFSALRAFSAPWNPSVPANLSDTDIAVCRQLGITPQQFLSR